MISDLVELRFCVFAVQDNRHGNDLTAAEEQVS